MQVGLTSSSLATGGAHSAAVSSSTVAPTQAVRQKLPATASEYPASPLITTRPQRYSVQLNDQLTTLQQAHHYLGQLEQQLLEKKVSLRVDGPARDWLAERGYDPLMGARPMSRVIREHIKKPLANEILFGQLVNGGSVQVKVVGDELAFEFAS